MLIPLAFALLVGGVYALIVAYGPAKTEQDVAESLRHDREVEKRLGFFSRPQRQIGWVYRAGYRHPVLVRLPAAVLLTSGFVLLIVALLMGS